MTRWGVAIAIGAGLLALYALRLDDIAGLYVDDAFYIVLAQALARGQGYALINSAATPVLPAFPPGFPLLLAPVVAVTSDFPANLVALKAVSIASMLGVAALTYWYFVRYRALTPPRAVTIAVITAILPAFVFLATSTVMAEGAFTLSLLASAIAIERAGRDSTRPTRDLIIAAVLSYVSLLIRSAGMAAVVAGVLFLAQRRGRRASAGFFGLWLLCGAPWMIYASTHAPTQAERDAHGGSIVYTYRELLSMRSGGDATSGTIDVAGLVKRVAKNVVNVFGRDMGAVMFPTGYRGASESGQEVFLLSGESGLQSGSMGLGPPVLVMSFAFSLFVVIGGFVASQRRLGVAEVMSVATIAMVVLVPARTFRYVLPIAPFLVSYFLTGVEAVAAWWRGAQAGAAAFRIAAACVLIFLLADHGQYIAQKFNGPELPWIKDGREVRGVTDWINAHVPAGGGIVTTNPGLVYLLTGHKTVALVDPLRRWERWKSSDMRYAVALHVASKPPRYLGFRVAYESPRLGLWVLELSPENP